MTAPRPFALERRLLGNGLEVFVRADPRLPLAFAGVGARAGSTLDPPGREGALRLLLASLRRGAGSRAADDLARDLEAIGASPLETLSSDHALAGLDFLSSRFEEGLALVADLVLRPRLDAAEVDGERRRLAVEVRREEEDAGTAASRKFERFLFASHAYARAPAGTPDGVAATSRVDLARLHAEAFAPRGAILVLLGDLHETRVESACATFSSWTGSPPPAVTEERPAATTSRRVVLVDRPGAAQAQIRIGAPLVARRDPDYFPLLVANAVLGGGFTSFLVEEIRVNRGLTYGVSSRLDARRAGGALRIETFTKTATAAETIEVALAQLARVRAGAFGAEDAERARRHLAGQWPLRVETAAGFAAALATAEATGAGASAVDAFVGSIRAVTDDSLRRVLPRLPRPENLLVFVEGNADALRGPLDAFGSVEAFGRGEVASFSGG